MTNLEPLMRRNFLEYASYVIVDRAIPDLRDGLKPVQRRILATLAKMDDGKFHKVANVIGECMKLHPHGDASIGDALVVLANKEFFIERQGNFGNVVTGHSAAAARYIECRLTPLAKETLFSKELTETRPSYDGRNAEPVFLPVKLPVILMLGTEGIAVGMSTRILPHNFTELLRAQVAVLRNEPVEVFPDFLTGGLMDISEYDDGRGRVRVRARLEVPNEKTIVVREIPWGTTTEHLIASIEAAAQKNKVKVAAINDFTTDRVEIEISLPRGVYAEEVVPQLYAHTDCEVAITSNMVMIRDRQPVELSVTGVLVLLTEQLRSILEAELELELGKLEDTRHWLTLERIFIENRIYKRIEEATTAEAVKYEVYAGLEAFEDQLIRPVTDDDIERLLKIPIRRISQYDIDRNRDEIAATEKAIGEVGRKLKRLTATTIAYLEDLIERYGDDHPRRTEITTFEAVDVRAVARQNLRAAYDPETGFFGTAVKSEKYQLQMSEYDKVLIVSKDGSYRIIGPEEKFLVPGKAAHIQLFDPEEGARFTVVYRDAGRIAWAKKIHIRAFIHNREYELIKGRKGKLDLLLPGHTDDVIHMDFVPAKRQRVHEARFDLSILEEVGSTARGRRLAPKPVARLRKLSQADAEAERAAQREAAATAGPEAEVEVDEDQLGLFDEE
jgi:topoisomerase-4 subunit A